MLFVPIWDMNHLKSVRFQYVTVSIILLNVIIYAVFESGLFAIIAPEEVVRRFALRPSDVKSLSSFIDTTPAHFKFITYMFLHGSTFHLLGNMLFLFVFGDNVEDAMGHVRFILFYLMCGVFAGIAHCFFTVSPQAILVGASGAISGVIGAYLMLHPNIRVWILMPLPSLPFLPLRFSAAFIIIVWIAYQAVSAILFPAAVTAWWAHLGGFFSGILLILFMRRPGVALFDKATGV